MKIKAIVFEFDGVIVRFSELIKRGAWGFVANHSDTDLYNAIVLAGIKDLGVAPEDRRVLRDLSKQYGLYINSSNLEKEMNDTIFALGLKSYFEGVYGQPRKKVRNLERIMKTENILPDNVLFISGNDDDFIAAQEFGCHFLGFVNSLNWWGNKHKTFSLIFNLYDIKNILA